jgi:hypothetical protein
VPSQEFLFHTSAAVRNMIQQGIPGWESLVPDVVLQQGPWKTLAAGASAITQPL